jgi:DNA primase
VPFYYQKRVVGYTARLIRDGKVKYISDQQPGYVFNLDRQDYTRQFVIVCEGPLDAICVDGVAVMSNELGPQQKHLIARLQREVIVVPDRDEAGLKMIEQAIEWGWSVSMPEWADGIKDINDAVQTYGKIYTLLSIVQAKESMPLKIQLRMKKWIGT